MAYFKTMVAKLSEAPNRVCKLFPNLERLKPYFAWVSTDKIKTMLDKTTQHYRGVIHFPFRKHFKSRYSGANVPRLNEWVATDTLFNDTPAMDDGIPGHGRCTMMQILYGLISGTVHGYPMKLEKQVAEAFEDHICKVGAPIGLKSDNVKSELHGKVKDILRLYNIDNAQSEPHYQHQNQAESKIQDIKQSINNTMDHVRCPAQGWLLCAIFTLMLFCHLPNVNGEIPRTVQTGQIHDILKFIHFHFWQEVFVESDKKGKKEELARWCFPAENVGDELTYMVLLTESEQLVPRSNVRPATDPLFPNLRKRPHTSLHPFTLDTVDDKDKNKESPRMTTPSGEAMTLESPMYNMQDRFDVPVNLPRLSPEERLGLTFLHT
jgi:hypothetical protein